MSCGILWYILPYFSITNIKYTYADINIAQTQWWQQVATASVFWEQGGIVSADWHLLSFCRIFGGFIAFVLPVSRHHQHRKKKDQGITATMNDGRLVHCSSSRVRWDGTYCGRSLSVYELTIHMLMQSEEGIGRSAEDTSGIYASAVKLSLMVMTCHPLIVKILSMVRVNSRLPPPLILFRPFKLLPLSLVYKCYCVDWLWLNDMYSRLGLLVPINVFIVYRWVHIWSKVAPYKLNLNFGNV